MTTVTSTLTQTERASGITCSHCGQQVKLNEIVRSPYHDLGCKHCYEK